MSPIRLDPFQMITAFRGGSPDDPRCLVDKVISTIAYDGGKPEGQRGVWENCTGIVDFPARDFIEEGVVGNDASHAWNGCSNMVSFGEIVLPLSVTGAFLSWGGCSSMLSFPPIDLSRITNFGRTWDGCSGLASFSMIDVSSAVSFPSTWRGCSSLTSFPAIDLSHALYLNSTWNGCSSLTSFPTIDTSLVQTFSSAWRGCSSLTSFPTINLSSATTISSAWRECSSLTSFPTMDTSSVTNISAAWRGCSSLTSFPAIDTSSVTNMIWAWMDCSSLTSFPGSMFLELPSATISVGLMFSGTPLSHDSLSSVLHGLASAPSTYSGFCPFDVAAPIVHGSAEHEWARQICNKGGSLSVRVYNSGSSGNATLRDCAWLLAN